MPTIWTSDHECRPNAIQWTTVKLAFNFHHYYYLSWYHFKITPSFHLLVTIIGDTIHTGYILKESQDGNWKILNKKGHHLKKVQIQFLPFRVIAWSTVYIALVKVVVASDNDDTVTTMICKQISANSFYFINWLISPKMTILADFNL